MRLYIAGLYTSNFSLSSRPFLRLDEREKQARLEVTYKLESYHYVGKQTAVDTMRRDKVKVFLDSGAFSAYTKGVQMDIAAYCDYIHENEDIIEVASVLDGIGDPLLTWQNQQVMESRGVKALPCFHYGEDERYLEHYISKYEYITLGGMVPIDKSVLVDWLDRLWDRYLTDGSGRPRLKVHGFGLTTANLMHRYPWFSIDSSSWVQQAANGNVVITDYTSQAKVIYLPVSTSSPRRHDENAHLDTLTAVERSALIAHVERAGFSMKRLQENWESRWAYNCGSYDNLGKRLTDADRSFSAIQGTLY